MKITVAIVTRNRCQLLKKTLSSLTEQSIKPNKVLVVDNASTDTTKRVVDSFRNKLPINYLVEKKIGIPFARNRALDEVTDGILTFIDDDCQAFPNWIENILKSHQKYPRTIAIQGLAISLPRYHPISIISQFNMEWAFKVNATGKIQPFSFYDNHLPKTDIALRVLDTKNVSFKLKPLQKMKLRFEVSILKHVEDFDFAKKLLFHQQNIIFCSDIKIHHWERPTISQFFIQRFTAAGGRAEIYNRWPREYFPQRKLFWYIERMTIFLLYCFKYSRKSQLFQTISLFALEQAIFMLGAYLERLKAIKFTNRPSSIQKINAK